MIITLLFILFFLCLGLYALKFMARRNYLAALFLIGVTGVGIFLVTNPDYATAIANRIGVGRGADLLLYLLFILSMVMVILVHGKIKKMDILITDLAREFALGQSQNSSNLAKSENAD